MKIEIFNDYETLQDLKEKWDRLLIESGCPIYMSYTWGRIWWKHYGKNKRLSLYLFSDENDKLVAIIPTYVETIRLLFLKMKVLRLVGANIPPKLFGLPIREGFEKEVLKLFLRETLSKRICDLISLGPLSQRFFTDHFKNLNIPGREFKIMEREYGPSIEVHLPDNLETYMNSLSSGEHRSYRRGLSRIKKAHDIVTERVETFDEESFSHFLELHKRQWNLSGKNGHFLSWPEGTDFNRDLSRSMAESGQYILYKLKADGKTISYLYGFTQGDKCYMQLTARSISRLYKSYNLGRLGFYNAVGELIPQGIRTIKEGLGFYQYKLKQKGEIEMTSIFRVVANSPGSLGKYMLFSAYGALIKLLYSKIWYYRIQPRMPQRFRFPIWPYSLKVFF